MKKILVIEDELGVRQNILELLGEEGFEVVGAENGIIGVGLAQKVLPDLILCDVMMPELDGYGVLAQLRELPQLATCPFVFLTAKAEKSELRQGMELGADDYVTKPFTREELLGAITTRLSKQDYITDQSQQKLEELRANLERALPQEFITPLSIILLFSQHIVEEGTTLELHEILQLAGKIYGNAQRLHHFIKNFLLHAELEVVALDPVKRQAFVQQQSSGSTKELISEVALHKAKQAGREGDLDLSLQETNVQIERNKLQKVLEELVDNAFRYSLNGTSVRIVSMCSGKELVIYVMDNGRGISAEQIQKIGEYSYLTRNIYEQQGAGLGLLITKRLVELYGGKLSIDSIIGVKTMIRFSFPLFVVDQT